MAVTDWYCEEVLPGKLKVDRIFEDEWVLAFRHPRPSARPHVVVIHKEHVPSLLDEKALDGALLQSMIRAVQHAAVAVGLDRENGFHLRANATAPGVREIGVHPLFQTVGGRAQLVVESLASASRRS
ncbi:MAG: HIT domain-containing protein [Chloroflexi bacterium]|nr:HIT domain-containing protein [Chloroflexota bacterium]